MAISKEFYHLLDLPHRRPAYGVNAPVVLRHIGYRIESPEADPISATSYSSSVTIRNQFIDALNTALFALQTCGGTSIPTLFSKTILNGQSGAQAHVDSASIPGGRNVTWIDPNRTLLSELKPAVPELASWRVRLRVDLHAEFYFITMILDQQSDFFANKDSDTSLVRGDAKRALDYESALSTDDHKLSAKEVGDFFYDAVWVPLNDCLKPALGELPGTQFAEFRAMAMRDLNSRFANTRPFVIDDPAENADFRESRRRLHSWLGKNREIIRDLLKFNQLTREIDRDANCVLCEALDGGAIYGSSLGQYPSEQDRPEGPTPLRYFIVYNNLSKYQLGRLIRRTHVLGQLRLAAAFDLPLLAEAGARIRALGNEIDQLLHNRKANNSQQPLTTLRPAELKKIQDSLHEIQSQRISGGLAYRVVRSRYYAGTFRTRVDEMRFIRLEGWEPYDEFVKRNIYQTYDFIDGVGSRYQTLAERVHRLTAAHNAEKLNGFQDNIGSLVQRMTDLTVEINDVQNDVKGLQQKILEIQDLGEAIGIGAFAYYGGQIISTFIKAVVKAGCLMSAAEEGCQAYIEKNQELIDLAAIVIALVIALKFLPRIWKHWKQRHQAPQRTTRT